MSEYRFSAHTAVAIIVANMVGTGVFVSLGFQLLEIQSPFVLIMLWLVGGVTALCGALTYAELGANLPRSGGEYNFLSQIYHPSLGFISGWVSVTVGFAAPTALVAMTFAAYLGRSFSVLSEVVMAVALVVVLACFHCISRRASGATQTVFTAIKIVLIVTFVTAVFLLADTPQSISLTPEQGDWKMIFSGTFAVALIYVNYAYTGWNAATYVTGELEHPQRRLPWILLIGTSIVLVLYLLLNYAFLYAAPMSALAGQQDLGVITAKFAFGDQIATVVAVALALLFVSTVSAMTMAGPRVLQVLGEDFSAFRFLAKTNRHGVPVSAIGFQSTLAVLFILTASFEFILLFTGFVLALNTLFVVLGVFILRWQGRSQQMLYRTWGYPVTPLIYLAITGWTLVYILITRPEEALAGLAIIGLGGLCYAVVSASPADAKNNVKD